MTFKRKITALIGVGLVSLVVFVGGGLYGYVRLAKSGSDMDATYYAYHHLLLGDVSFGNCSIRLSEPWFPKLSSYESLLIAGNQADFVDINGGFAGAKATSVSFVRDVAAVNPSALKPAEIIGNISTRFIESPNKDLFPKAYALLTDSGYYAISQDFETLRRAIAASTIKCKP